MWSASTSCACWNWSEQGEFDSLGHLDLVRRYRPKELGPFDTMAHAEVIRAILGTLVQRDKAFEINTSPLRRGLDATCPDLTVLRWYKELGGEKLTIGSDAHRPDQVGTGFEVALDMLRAAGFSRIVTVRAEAARMPDSVVSDLPRRLRATKSLDTCPCEPRSWGSLRSLSVP